MPGGRRGTVRGWAGSADQKRALERLGLGVEEAPKWSPAQMAVRQGGACADCGAALGLRHVPTWSDGRYTPVRSGGDVAGHVVGLEEKRLVCGSCFAAPRRAPATGERV